MSGAGGSDQWFIGWVLNAAVALLYAMFGALWVHVGQTKKDAVAIASDVRRELLAASERERADRAARVLEHREDLNRVWTEVQTGQRAVVDAHQRMLDQLGTVTERLGHMPTRDEMKADGAEREARIMALVRPVRAA